MGGGCVVDDNSLYVTGEGQIVEFAVKSGGLLSFSATFGLPSYAAIPLWVSVAPSGAPGDLVVSATDGHKAAGSAALIKGLPFHPTVIVGHTSLGETGAWPFMSAGLAVFSTREAVLVNRTFDGVLRTVPAAGPNAAMSEMACSADNRVAFVLAGTQWQRWDVTALDTPVNVTGEHRTDRSNNRHSCAVSSLDVFLASSWAPDSVTSVMRIPLSGWDNENFT